MSRPKILIGCPTFKGKRYCLDDFSEGIKNLSYDNFDVLLVDNSEGEEYYNEIKKKGLPVIKYKQDKLDEEAKHRIANSRNLLREKTLNGGYDYLFSLEQDVIPPKDAVQKLLSHSKKIVSGLYFKFEEINNEIQMSPLVYRALTAEVISELTGGEHGENVIEEMKRKGTWDSHWRVPFTFEDVKEPRLMRIDFCGMGCILIHREVLEKTRFRADSRSFDDMYFCEDARNLGYEIWADTSVKCRHIIGRTSWEDVKI